MCVCLEVCSRSLLSDGNKRWCCYIFLLLRTVGVIVISIRNCLTFIEKEEIHLALIKSNHKQNFYKITISMPDRLGMRRPHLLACTQNCIDDCVPQVSESATLVYFYIVCIHWPPLGCMACFILRPNHSNCWAQAHSILQTADRHAKTTLSKSPVCMKMQNSCKLNTYDFKFGAILLEILTKYQTCGFRYDSWNVPECFIEILENK